MGMRAIGWVIFQVVALLSLQAHVEPTYYLHGCMGSYEVGVQIDHFQDAAYFRYFKVEDKVDIILSGNIVGNDSALFFFERKEGERVLETVKVRHLRDETWEGTWRVDGITFTITLEPIEKDSINHAWNLAAEFKRIASPYSYFRTRDVELQEVMTTSFGAYQVNWLLEPISEAMGIQVIGSSDTDSLNSTLLSQLFNHIDQYFNCGTYGYRGRFIVEEMEVLYLQGDLLSYRFVTKSACYGQQENINIRYQTMRVSTGKPVRLEDVFYIGEGEAPKQHSSGWFTYRRGAFKNFVVDRLRELYPATFESATPRLNAWEQPVWYLSGDGVAMGAALPPGSNKDCKEPTWLTIPYEELGDYLKVDMTN